jgi:hypothetical protein
MVQKTPVLLRCNGTGQYSLIQALWGKEKSSLKRKFQHIEGKMPCQEVFAYEF